MMEVFLENLQLHTPLYQTILFLYGIASFAFFLEYFVEKKYRKKTRGFSLSLFFLAFLCQLIWFIQLWHQIGRAPIRTRYESLILYCLCVALVYLFLELLFRSRLLGFFSSLACFLILVYATIHRDLEFEELPPALQSLWFIPHVVTYFFAYGALTLAFFTSLLYLLFPEMKVEKQSPFFSKEKSKWINLNEMSYEIIQFGFTMLTFGLILGSFWAKFAWGTYWGWDPKENWALVTWLIYLTYLHLRYLPQWKHRQSALFAIIGYIAVLFTYLGMKYLPTAQSSLHIYQ